MEWIKKEDNYIVPIKSWCGEIEDGALAQAADLARHPAICEYPAPRALGVKVQIMSVA